MDPSGVYALNEFDECTGTVGGHAVLSQGIDPVLAGNGHGAMGRPIAVSSAAASVIAGVILGAGDLDNAVYLPAF